MTNFYDLENLSDLPESLKKMAQTKCRTLSSLNKLVLNLFSEQDYLCMRQILVGLYRKHNRTTSYAALRHTLAALFKKDKIDSATKDFSLDTLFFLKDKKNV